MKLLKNIALKSFIHFNCIKWWIFYCFAFSISSISGQTLNKIGIDNTYPWCIVAYDSLKRSPEERIDMIKNLGFEKYAYDWRNEHLDDTFTELELAVRNNIEVIGVWLWLNAKRDSLQHLSADNERLLQIIKQLNLKTTFWVGFNGNFFKGLDQEQSVKKATDLVGFIAEKVTAMDCKIALYNHSGWFGNPLNQLEVIQKLPEFNIGIIYNFHHAHGAIDDLENVANSIVPYLKAVNLNGMEVDGKKILPIGHGKHEKEMIRALQKSGFKGPWGILGHVASRDAKEVLEENLNGLKVLLAPE